VRPQSSDGCIWSADLCHYLNPNDLTNRVFLHYAGEEIHFDAALATLPSDILRAVLVAKNPKAQSDFFRPTSKGSSDTSSVGTWTNPGIIVLALRSRHSLLSKFRVNPLAIMRAR